MGESNKVPNFPLMCLRLETECRSLAAEVPEPDLKARFALMASMWAELAAQTRVLH
jgi:hypothetical protein